MHHPRFRAWNVWKRKLMFKTAGRFGPNMKPQHACSDLHRWHAIRSSFQKDLGKRVFFLDFHSNTDLMMSVTNIPRPMPAGMAEPIRSLASLFCYRRALGSPLFSSTNCFILDFWALPSSCARGTECQCECTLSPVSGRRKSDLVRMPQACKRL